MERTDRRLSTQERRAVDTYVVGVGMTNFGKLVGATLGSLALQAAQQTLGDAGADVTTVDTVVFANAFQGALDGQHSVRGQMALRDLALGGVGVINVENACASASTALNVAVAQVGSGMADVALAIGAEKMTGVPVDLVANGFDGCWDVARKVESLALLDAIGSTARPESDFEENPDRSVFMDIYAALAKSHMGRFGTTVRQLAAVAAKNHLHSEHNPRAQYQRRFTIDEVLAARGVVWPFTTPMCSPLSDGAAAALVCSRAALRRFPDARPVRLRSSVVMSGAARDPDDLDRHVSRRAAHELAGIGPEDIDVAEVHDATAFGEIQQTENLGLCKAGEGGVMAERGETSLSGSVPVNPSGGLESRGHPVGATGLAQIFELVTQLRGAAVNRQVRGARIAVAENGGGLLGVEEAAASVTVLEAVQS
jgi:acetyl-CoA acetyltransferase